MHTIAHTNLRSFGYSVFKAAGVPEDQAIILTDHLVEANLMGHDSHGVVQMPRYANSLFLGKMQPVGDHKIIRETLTSLVIDANRSIGIVLAYQAMKMAVERAKQYTFGAVAVHRSTHIGRLGAFPPIAAEEDCIGLLLLNGSGRFVAPFGGTARRLPPNPIAMSVPTKGAPMTLDITTSVVAGGKVEVAKARNQPVPEGWLIDEGGETVTDPGRFVDGEVAMLPLGGPLGHKGYGLAMMIDAIAGGLSWAGCSAEKPTRGGSGWIAIAINIGSFIDPTEYKKEVQGLIDWVKSTPAMPSVDQIYLPGEIEQARMAGRLADGIPIEETTWNRLLEIADKAQIAHPQP